MGSGRRDDTPTRAGRARPSSAVVDIEILGGDDRGAGSGRPSRVGTVLVSLTIVVLLAALAGALYAAWSAEQRAGAAERDLDLARDGVAVLRQQRDEALTERDLLRTALEEAETAVSAAAEGQGDLQIELERLRAENLLLRSSVAVSSVAGAGDVIAVTFSGDPTLAELGEVVGALEAAGATATFFPSGESLEALSRWWSEAVAAGHELGGSTYDGSPLDPADLPDAVLQLDGWQQAAAGVVGDDNRVRWFRPPALDALDRYAEFPELGVLIGERGMVTALWSVETWYALYSPSGPQTAGPDPDATAVADYVLARSEGGSIVLLQFGTRDVEALAAILEGFGVRGLQPVTLTALLAGTGEDS